MKPQVEPTDPDKMANNPDNYKWYIFYYNPKDKRIFVPKINRWFGWTLNFGNLYSYLVFVCILAIAIVIGYL